MNAEPLIRRASLGEVLRYSDIRHERRFAPPPPPPAGFGSWLLGPDAGVAPPAPPPASGMTCWLNGRNGLPSVGSFVSSWTDQSGAGHNATQGTPSAQPKVTTTINSRTSVDFYTGGSGVQLQITTLGNLITAGAWTAFTVHQYYGGSVYTPFNASNSPIISGDAGQWWGLYCGTTTLNTGPEFVASSQFSSGYFQAQDSVATYPVNIFSGHRYDNTGSLGLLQVQLERQTLVTHSSVGNVGNVSNMTFLLGQGGITTPQLSVGEYITYNRVLTDPEFAGVMAYLAFQWGL